MHNMSTVVNFSRRINTKTQEIQELKKQPVIKLVQCG